MIRTTTFKTRAIASVTGLALLVSIGSGAFARPVHAQLVVADPTNLIQNTISALNSAAEYTLDYVLNTLAWQVGNLAIDSIVKSTVNWINSGFQGSPAFVTDLNQNLQGVGDAVARRFFDELSDQTIAITPFQDKVLDAVRLGYYLSTSPESFYTKNPYTLNQVSANDKAFLQGDFSQGGWNAWFSTVMNPQNNMYGSQMLAEQALSNTVRNATSNRVQELSWNKGFLSWRGECKQYKPNATQQETLTSLGSATTDAEGNIQVTTNTQQVTSLKNEDNCVNYAIETPGSVIMESLNKTTFAGIDRLVSADQFNEIIGALLNQLVKKVLGGGEGGGGLRSISKPSAGGGSSFVDTATNGSASGAANVGPIFLATVARQQEFIAQYRAGWEKIRAAAETAKQRCNNTDADPTPDEVIARANAALVKASNAEAALDSIETQAQAASDAAGDRSAEMLTIATEYTNLTNSTTLPNSQELAEAQTQSLDTGDVEPGSLYSQMVRLTTVRGCLLSD